MTLRFPCICTTVRHGTGEVYETECYFPTWINKENAAHVQALYDAHVALFGDHRMGPDSTKELRNRPLIDKWTFSTNGVAIQAVTVFRA